MSTHTRDDHVLPRPVERLSEYANAKARANASDKLTDLFGLSEAAARSIADTAVDPAELRKAADAPERIPVPGGTLLGIRSEAWSRRILPDPRNPRIGPARRHPFAVDPGTSEECRFRPVPEPSSVGVRPELEVEIESREHLTWAADQAKRYVMTENDWRDSIRSQGVMTEVWVTATTYRHEDGSPDLCAVTTAEGSSRMTGVHDILGERSVDLAYDSGDRQVRSVIRRLNDAFGRGPSSEDLTAMRCEIVPALFLVGFAPHHGGTEEFATAVKSLVALRHVDPPTPWGEGPEMESLADAALEELERQGVLTPDRRRWMAGAITRQEAEHAHLSSDPAVRAAAIIEVFTSDDPQTRDAIRLAVTAQSTRKRISPKLMNQLATALIVRAVSGGGDHVDRVRRYMRHGFAKPLREGDWTATTRSADELVTQALAEIGRGEDSGKASLELAARAAYPLITSLKLWGDQGSGREQPDRRTPGEVIDVMRRGAAGVHQLGQALKDHASNRTIRAVDATGAVITTDDGSQDQYINDTHLRSEFPPAGAVKRPKSPQTSHEELEAALADLGGTVNDLVDAIAAVKAVKGVDGMPLVDVEGVDRRHCDAWRDELSAVEDDLVVWGRLSRRRAGVSTVATVAEDNLASDEDDVDAIVSDWDDQEEGGAAEQAEAAA